MICMNNQCRCAPPNRPDRICDSPRSESEMIATIARDRRNNERHVDGKTSGGDRRRLICRLAVSSAAMFSRVLTVCRGATFSVAERERRARRVIEIAERSRARAEMRFLSRASRRRRRRGILITSFVSLASLRSLNARRRTETGINRRQARKGGGRNDGGKAAVAACYFRK